MIGSAHLTAKLAQAGVLDECASWSARSCSAGDGRF